MGFLAQRPEKVISQVQTFHHRFVCQTSGNLLMQFIISWSALAHLGVVLGKFHENKHDIKYNNKQKR